MALFLSHKYTADELFVNELIERQVNRFLVAYANAFNKAYKRSGSLFQSPFRRSIINDDVHLQQAIIYVHANAQKHDLINDYRSYLYSSYHKIISGISILIDVAAILDFFRGLKEFITLHEQQVAYYYDHNWPSSRLEV